MEYKISKNLVFFIKKKNKVSTFLSSFGLLGIIVSIRLRLVPVSRLKLSPSNILLFFRVRAPLHSFVPNLNLLLPRPGQPLSQEAFHLFEVNLKSVCSLLKSMIHCRDASLIQNTDYQEFFMPQPGNNHLTSSSELPLRGKKNIFTFDHIVQNNCQRRHFLDLRARRRGRRMDDFPFGKEYFGRLCQGVSSQVGGGADQRLGHWGEVGQIFCLKGLFTFF